MATLQKLPLDKQNYSIIHINILLPKTTNTKNGLGWGSEESIF